MTLIKVKDLRGLREQRGLSLREAAEKLKISEQTLSNVERGTYINSTRHEIVRNYIRFLQVDGHIQLREYKPQEKLKTAERVGKQKYRSLIEKVSVEEGRKLGQWRLRLGITKVCAAKLIGKTTYSITNKERGLFLFTRKEYDTLKAAYEIEEKFQELKEGVSNE